MIQLQDVKQFFLGNSLNQQMNNSYTMEAKLLGFHRVCLVMINVTKCYRPEVWLFFFFKKHSLLLVKLVPWLAALEKYARESLDERNTGKLRQVSPGFFDRYNIGIYKAGR